MKSLFSILLFGVATLPVANAAMPEPMFVATWDNDAGADLSPGAAAPKAPLGTVIGDGVVGKGALSLREVDNAVAFQNVTYDGSSGTIALWWRPNFDLVDNPTPKAILYWSNLNASDRREIILRIADSREPHDKLQFVTRGGGDPQIVQTKIDSWIKGAWHWIVVTWTGSTGAIYVDGAEAARMELPEQHMDLEQLIVGTIFGNQAAADFDNLQIWTEELTPKQIERLYNEQSEPRKK